MSWNSRRRAFASQVGPKGKVIGIDHIKELVDDSLSNVKKDDPSLITSGRVKLIGESTQAFPHGGGAAGTEERLVRGRTLF